MKKPKTIKLSKKEIRVLQSRYYRLGGTQGFGKIDDFISFVSGKSKETRREKVKRWLFSQENYALHYPIRKKYTRQRIFIEGIHEQWEADLMFIPFKNNNAKKPVLTCLLYTSPSPRD